MNGIGLRITDIDLLERGDQLAVRLRIALAGGQSAAGVTTESLASHWHGPGAPPDGFQDICRGALWRARDAYLACARGPSLATAFACFERNHQPLLDAARRRGEPALIGAFGAALLDRALVDALCRARGLSFASAIRGNAVGIRMLQAGGGVDRLASIGAGGASGDYASHIGRLFGQLGVAAFASGLTPRPRIAWRQRIESPDAPLVDGVGDFVVGLGGDVREDLERLRALAARLDALPGYRLALDGDERFASFEPLGELMRALEREPALRRLHASLAWIEQPLPRANAFERAFDPQAIGVPVIVDESDAEPDDFARAIAIGYRGVTTDASKGLYPALLNAARCHRASTVHNRLMTVAAATANRHGNGLLQQLALAGLLDQPTIGAIGAIEAARAIGASDATPDEGSAAAQEQRPYQAAHPDLFRDPERGGSGLRIENGALSLESLTARGFGTAVDPDFSSWTPMPQPLDGLLQRNYSKTG